MIWNEPTNKPMIFTLQEPLVFAEGDTSNKAVVPFVYGLRRCDIVRFEQGQELYVATAESVTTFIRRQQYATKQVWYSGVLPFLPTWIRRKVAPAPIKIWPKLILPTGTQGAPIYHGYTEGASHIFKRKA